jgi:hypothetical protein
MSALLRRPKPPASVELVGQRFTIEVVPETDRALVPKSVDMPMVGNIRVASQRIVMADDLGIDQERDTLVHEILHGLVRVIGLNLRDSLEERIVGTLSPVLLDLLRSNPEVVAYLTAR